VVCTPPKPPEPAAPYDEPADFRERARHGRRWKTVLEREVSDVLGRQPSLYYNGACPSLFMLANAASTSLKPRTDTIGAISMAVALPPSCI
jgi:hypothetical protein